jgi:hypothetical protein
VLGDDLHRAVLEDVHDAAARDLSVGECDKDVVAGLPAGFWLVHGASMRCARRGIQGPCPLRLRSGQVGWLEVWPDPAEAGGMTPAVVFEAGVGVDLDDQQRLGRRVVDEISRPLPES